MVTINSSGMHFNLQPDYMWTFIICTGVYAVQGITPMAVVKQRQQIFGMNKFMDNFKKDHEIAFGSDAKLDMLGFPDTGSGWYSNKLSYKQWYEFNCAQRAHLNQVE